MKTELQRIPGVGKATEADLIRLGYPTIASLRGADPEELYKRDCMEPVSYTHLFIGPPVILYITEQIITIFI